ncbi:NADPH-dependent aldo-keto reductase, chloroplastic [Linum perenne]
MKKSNIVGEVGLNNGVRMPLMGLGTYSAQNDSYSTQHAIHLALQVGYRHFDTAKIYGSESNVGKALTDAFSQGNVEREDVFVTSKLWGSDHHDPVSALRRTLKNLRMEYLDLYLVHWPVKLKPWASSPMPQESEFDGLDLESTWAGMERCIELGLCRSIGVSNFSSPKIQSLLRFATIPPAVNQVEMHPMWRQTRLREVCEENNIHVSAYSPLGGPGNAWGSTAVVESPIVRAIAHEHGASPAQVALQWGLSKGASVIVKSFNSKRIKENMDAFHLRLDDEEIDEIDRLLPESKIMRGDFLINDTTSPYRSLEELWDGEI